MKKIKAAVILLFIFLLFLPLCTFNWEKDAVSAIDNRSLAPNPFTKGETNRAGRDLTKDIEAFVSDRIGLRDPMILGYTLLNDRMFGKMVHPSYMYGKEGYVFFKFPRAAGRARMPAHPCGLRGNRGEGMESGSGETDECNGGAGACDSGAAGSRAVSCAGGVDPVLVLYSAVYPFSHGLWSVLGAVPGGRTGQAGEKPVGTAGGSVFL